jgi:hypothetical protein
MHTTIVTGTIHLEPKLSERMGIPPEYIIEKLKECFRTSATISETTYRNIPIYNVSNFAGD